MGWDAKDLWGETAPISVWAAEQLLIDCEKRGLDATGCAVQYGDGTIHVAKAAMQAWKFVKSDVWKKFVDKHSDGTKFKPEIRTLLGHARAQSVGGAWKNENNHPIWAGHSAVTHNGGVRNHEYLFKDLQLKREAEVDSDVIRAILDKWGLTGEGMRYLNRLSGPVAMAAVSQDYPDRFLLARSGSPLSVGAFKDAGWMVWASRKDAIHRISRDWEEIWGMDFQRNRADLVFNPFPWERVVVWEGNRVVAKGMFTSNNGQKHELSYTCHTGYAGKLKENREKAAVAGLLEGPKEGEAVAPVGATLIECPSKCGKIIEFTEEELKLPAKMFVCPNCGTSMAAGEA